MTNTVLHRKVTIPIYDCDFHLVVARDVVKAAKEMTKMFPNQVDDTDGFVAAAFRNASTNTFGAFFSTGRSLCHDIIAHELFHITMRVMRHIDDRFHIDNSEPYAYLNGWLHDWVYKQLKKGKVRVV